MVQDGLGGGRWTGGVEKAMNSMFCGIPGRVWLVVEGAPGGADLALLLAQLWKGGRGEWLRVRLRCPAFCP